MGFPARCSMNRRKLYITQWALQDHRKDHEPRLQILGDEQDQKLLCSKRTRHVTFHAIAMLIELPEQR